MANSLHDWDDLLTRLSDEIDVGQSRYEDAASRYQAVGNWLDGDKSILKPYNPDVYVQGSFSLGTAIKPYGDHGEYDIDAVCVLRNPPIPDDDSATEDDRQWLKQAIGDRLKESGVYGPMVQPKEGKRRCWRIQYADGSKFHMDLCPAVNESVRSRPRLTPHQEVVWDNYILLTDNQDWAKWINGNAKGYQAWFAARMATRLLVRQRQVFAREGMTKYARVQDVPQHAARTTLQRSIQILKRHRDIRYEDDEDAPISIIITTLAAKAYNNEVSIFDALKAIVAGMRSHIDEIDGEYIIENPVDPRENFADKWNETTRKAEVFFDWLDSLESLLDEVTGWASEEELRKGLGQVFGTRDSNATLNGYKIGNNWRFIASAQTKRANALIPYSPHAKDISSLGKAVRTNTHTASLTCSMLTRVMGRRTGRPVKNGRPIAPGRKIKFHVNTSVPRPFKVWWQITNTGDEAQRANALRGDFYGSSFEVGKSTRKEETLYHGDHWAKAMIEKDGVIVAVSEPFIVVIRQGGQ